MWSFDKSALTWDKEYLSDIQKSAKDRGRILKNQTDWTIIMHKRVYLKKAHSDLRKRPLDVIRKVKVPVLILRGRKDTIILPEHVKSLGETLEEAGNNDYEIIYFNRLNHFFGKKLDDGIHRTRISVDPKVTNTIIKWLNKNLKSPPAPEEAQKEKGVS